MQQMEIEDENVKIPELEENVTVLLSPSFSKAWKRERCSPILFTTPNKSHYH